MQEAYERIDICYVGVSANVTRMCISLVTINL